MAAASLGLAACGGTASENNNSHNTGSKGTLTVVDTGFAETEVLAAMYADVLNKAGYKTKQTSVKSSELAQGPLEKGDIAVEPAYVATYAQELNQLVNGANAKSVASPDLTTAYASLQKLAKKRGLTALTPSKALDQNAFAVSTAFATKHHLTTLSDLGKLGIPVTLAAGRECATRPLCQPGLEKTYGIKVTKIDPLDVDTPKTKQAVRAGADQLGLVLTTDPSLQGLVVLKDDKGLQPADYLVPIVNTKKLKPDIKTALNKLSATLTSEELGTLDAKVSVSQQKPAQVASDYLKSKNLG